MNLATVDTLLAFATMMTVLSVFVTAFVQLVSALLQMRSNNLVWGLQRLFDQLDPNDELGDHARRLAEAIVKQTPAISGATPVLAEGSKAAQWVSNHKVLDRAAMMLGKGSHAIKPEELVKTLRDLARADNPGGLPEELHGWLKALVGDPAAADLLGRAGAVADEVARLMPAQAELAREAVHRALQSGDALAQRVAEWFDTVMDRTAERFTLHCRYLTMLGAAVVVLLTQVDSLWLFHQLGTNPKQREQILSQVDELAKLAPAAADAGCRKKDTAQAPSAQDEAAFKACVEKLASELGAARQRAQQALAPMIDVGSPAADSVGLQRVLGFVLSWALLSLGAPFWFNVLKSLSSLRPLMASRADAAKG